MSDIELSVHAKAMLKERKILEEWVWRTINAPDRKKKHADDGNMHYTKAIKERSGQVLHVVVNQNVQPHRIVTVFFDRRLRKKNEIKN
jgi:hypothetical protein